MERVAHCLDSLARHVSQGEVAITGSVAIGGREVADLDLVVTQRQAVAPSVGDDFLISHYHDGGKLAVQLVEPFTRLRIDLFLDSLGAIARARPGPFGWPVVDPADLLAHKLQLLASATAASPVAPKHADDARALAARLGMPPPVVAPELLRNDVYATDVTASCARCQASADPRFRLAPKSEIFAVLGYV